MIHRYSVLGALMFLGAFSLQARESGKPAGWDFALESLSGVAGGVGVGYLGAMIGQSSAPNRDFKRLKYFVDGARIGYIVGTTGGIYSYSRLAGKEHNLPATLLATTISGLAVWYLLENFYKETSSISPTLFLVLPNLTGVMGNNIRLMITKDAGAGVAWVGGF